MEGLRVYIREVMYRKNLKAIDIESRSGGQIKDSYISDILNGKTKSISVDKVNALAQGLGVNSFEVFQAASGGNIQGQDDPWPSSLLVNTMTVIMHSPDLTAIVKSLIAMKPAKIKALRKQIEKSTK